MRVISSGRSGRLAMVDGDIVDARLPPHDAMRSVREMLSWTDPTLVVEPLTDWARRAIELPLPHLLMEAGFDAVVHLAANPSPQGWTEERMFRHNTTTTYNVFRAATMLGMRRVVWASSETTLGLPFEKVLPHYARST
ncbi:MAG: NAD-dependent epimerase/dehydratase family protein, partial [Deltaproteobacteria bacterium]|nr:NAD-dependent epimerase/dehydratase family protein [Deltaproteobacteria bacterium]